MRSLKYQIKFIFSSGFFLFVLMANCQIGLAQNISTEDSLNLLKYYEQFKKYLSTNNLENAFHEIQKMEQSLNQISSPFFTSKLNKMYGLYYTQLGKDEMAISYFLKSFSIDEKLRDYKALSGLSHNIAILYKKIGNQSQVINYYEKAIQYDLILNDQQKLAEDYLQVANLYLTSNQFDKAEKNFLKVLEFYKNKKDVAHSIQILNNLSILTFNQKKYNKTIEYINQALTLGQNYKSSYEIKVVLDNLIKMQNKITQEQSIVKDSLSKDTNIQAFSQVIKNAEQKLNLPLLASTKSIHNPLSLKDTSELKKIKSTLFVLKDSIQQVIDSGNYEKAIQLYSKYERLLDSAQKIELTLTHKINEMHQQNLIQKMNYEQKLKTERYKIYGAVTILAIVLVFFGILGFQFKEKNKLLKQLQGAYQQIELKNKSIQQSIQYAKRIQTALMTQESTFEQILSEYFIIYKPKDIVSGDFYWINQRNNEFVLAVADCTGHGVPGAFLSMLCINILDNLWKNRIHSIPDMYSLLIETLNNKLNQNNEIKDSIEITFLKRNIVTQKTEIFTTRTPVYVLKTPSKEIEKIKTKNELVDLSINEKDQIFIFTDGLIDQRNADKKKLSDTIIKENLSNFAALNLSEQKDKWNEFLNNWLQNTEQIDDITIVSIKV